MTKPGTNPSEFDGGPALSAPPPLASGVVDPELLALPAPPRTRRVLSLALLGSVVVAAAALLLHLRGDVVYAFGSAPSVDVGEAASAHLAELVPNSYVRVHGSPMLSRMVRYEHALSGETYALFPLAGQRQIFVQVPLAALRDPARIAQSEFSGRLLTFGQLGGRLRPVRQYLAREMSLPVTPESFVVLAEQPPGAYGWAIALSALCAAILVLALGLIWRWFVPLGSRAV